MDCDATARCTALGTADMLMTREHGVWVAQGPPGPDSFDPPSHALRYPLIDCPTQAACTAAAVDPCVASGDFCSTTAAYFLSQDPSVRPTTPPPDGTPDPGGVVVQPPGPTLPLPVTTAPYAPGGVVQQDPTGDSHGACDPGQDTGWLHVGGKTFACIFSGDIWADRDLLSAKQSCVTRLTLDFAPFLKALRAPAYWNRFEALQMRLAKASKAVKRLGYSKDADALDDAFDLASIKRPSDLPLTVVSSNRVMGALIAKLGRGGKDAQMIATELAALNDALGEFIADLTGASDVQDCITIFAAS